MKNILINGTFIIMMVLIIGMGHLSPVAAAGQQTQSAYYIVIEQDSDGNLTPVYARIYQPSTAFVSLSEERLYALTHQPNRNDSTVAVQLKSPTGQLLYQSMVSIPTMLRGEFASDDPDAPIDGHFYPTDAVSFVVRLPVYPSANLYIQNGQSRAFHQIPEAQILAVLDSSRQDGGTRGVILDNGDPANRVDILVMGDGYTAAQEATFNTDAANIASGFFNLSPLSTYKNYYNVSSLFTASSESGADHPPYSATCIQGQFCCKDPAASSDPRAGDIKDTAFNASFCFQVNTHRLLVVSSSKIFTAAAANPDWDVILVTVNDPVYGGSGGWLAVFSKASGAISIAQHEYGHSFIDLADEYTSAYSYPACSDYGLSGTPFCESNVTDVTEVDAIKWRSWILPTTPIPTTGSQPATLVGLFEGARYQTSGMYRSGYSCIMRSLGAPFCPVPSQQNILKLYGGGWGEPAAGISMIELGSTLPADSSFEAAAGTALSFSFDLLQPIGGPAAEVDWFVDGNLMQTGGSSFTWLSDSASTPATVTVNVHDATTLVKDEMAGDLLRFSHTWTVDLYQTVFLPLISITP